MLEALEDLNLRDMTSLPTRIGGELQRAGVADPYRWSITELIDVVFDLQEPLLERLRESSTRMRQELRARR